MGLMTIKLYDLTDATREIFFSPYCWRARMALAHKGLAFESIPWHFTDTDMIKNNSAGRVPVIVDGDRWVHESFDIARYLDEQYPDRPMLMKDDGAVAAAQFVDAWCNYQVFPALRPISVFAVYEIIHDKDKAYFRDSRETMLKEKLEEISKDPEAERKALAVALRPADVMLAKQRFFGGNSPSYADYVVFGTLMWPYQVCPASPLETGTNVDAWFNRLLDLNDGFARAAKRVMATA